MKPRNIKTKELSIGDIVFRKSVDDVHYAYYISDIQRIHNYNKITYKLIAKHIMWPHYDINLEPEQFFEFESILYKVKKT